MIPVDVVEEVLAGLIRREEAKAESLTRDARQDESPGHARRERKGILAQVRVLREAQMRVGTAATRWERG